MFSHYTYDAIVVGSGPNGLAAAITLARAGCSVLVLEAEATIGGGARSAALTLPDFIHDTCSAVHPLGIGSPFFRTLPLANHGLEWIHPPVPLAHPFDDGTAAVFLRSTWHSTDQFPGGQRHVRGPGLSTSGAPWPRLPPPSALSGAVSTLSDCSYWSRSRVCLTQPVPRSVSIPSGPTVTYPMDRR